MGYANAAGDAMRTIRESSIGLDGETDAEHEMAFLQAGTQAALLDEIVKMRQAMERIATELKRIRQRMESDARYDVRWSWSPLTKGSDDD